MNPITRTLSDARALISNPDNHCIRAYGMDAEHNVCMEPPHRGVFHDADWCQNIREQYAARQPASCCIVTAIAVAAPTPDIAAQALAFADQQAKTQGLLAKHNWLEVANNEAEHSTLLGFLDVAIGNSTLPVSA